MGVNIHPCKARKRISGLIMIPILFPLRWEALSCEAVLSEV
jgi:hypothetical protein